MTSPERADGGVLGVLRALAFFAVAGGAAGSIGLMLRAGRHTPRLLLVLFLIWVLSPFVALGWFSIRSKRWPVPARVTLYCVTLVITLVTLTLYGGVTLPPARSPRAFVFVVVPPASWLFMTTAVGIAAFVSRRSSRT